MQTVFRLLCERTRHDFSNYKPSTLKRRIDRRMAIHAIPTLAEYADFLQHNSQEVDLLFKEVLIGVTSFFRDVAVWEHLAAQVVPELLERRSGEFGLRAWVIGCSSGEEAYSLAMVFTEVMEQLPTAHGFSLQIFASDLSPDAISVARCGHYPLSIRQDVSEKRLARFFNTHETHYQINKNIRDMVLFAQHDVLLDPPFTKLDLLACRNLMIYLDAKLQRRLVPLFHYSLRPGGVLLLGTSETVERFNLLFIPINSKLRTYLRQNNATAVGVDFPVQPRRPRLSESKGIYVSPSTTNPSAITRNLQQAADQPGAAAGVCACSRRQQPGRHRLYQRPHREISGTGSRQSQLELPCHGARGPARAPRGGPAPGRHAEAYSAVTRTEGTNALWRKPDRRRHCAGACR